MGKSKKNNMSEQTKKIIINIVITLVIVVIGGFFLVSYLNSRPTKTILGTWQATAKDGTVIEYEFTDDYKNRSTKDTLYTLTVTHPNGKKEVEEGYYVISNDTMLDLRPDSPKKGLSSNDDESDNVSASFEIKGDTLNITYSADFEEAKFSFKKTKDYVKKTEEK